MQVVGSLWRKMMKLSIEHDTIATDLKILLAPSPLRGGEGVESVTMYRNQEQRDYARRHKWMTPGELSG